MPPYSMIIQWSNEDSAFAVSLPEFLSCTTHGETYTEAVQNGQENDRITRRILSAGTQGFT